jgi:hypothetical protein
MASEMAESLKTAEKLLREAGGLISEAITQHIYDFDNGDKPSPDCAYVQMVKKINTYLGEDRQDGLTRQEWLDMMFEFEYCAECGGDADDHDCINSAVGTFFARCKYPRSDTLSDEEMQEELACRRKNQDQGLPMMINHVGFDPALPGSEATSCRLNSTGWMYAPGFIQACINFWKHGNKGDALQLMVTAWPQLPCGVVSMILDGTVQPLKQGESMVVTVPVQPEKETYKPDEPTPTALDVRFNTYHGNWLGPDRECLYDEYGGPAVPVRIKVEESYLLLELLPDDEDHASIGVERQTDRWLVTVTPVEGADPAFHFAIMDDRNISVYSASNFRNEYLHFTENKLPVLPASECRFGAPPRKES